MDEEKYFTMEEEDIIMNHEAPVIYHPSDDLPYSFGKPPLPPRFQSEKSDSDDEDELEKIFKSTKVSPFRSKPQQFSTFLSKMPHEELGNEAKIQFGGNQEAEKMPAETGHVQGESESGFLGNGKGDGNASTREVGREEEEKKQRERELWWLQIQSDNLMRMEEINGREEGAETQREEENQKEKDSGNERSPFVLKGNEGETDLILNKRESSKAMGGENERMLEEGFGKSGKRVNFIHEEK